MSPFSSIAIGYTTSTGPNHPTWTQIPSQLVQNTPLPARTRITSKRGPHLYRPKRGPNILHCPSDPGRQAQDPSTKTPPVEVLPVGECVSLNKSRPRRADAQWLVTTRLLDHVHDPLAQLGRLQRIRPRAPLNDNPSASWGCFSTPPVADLFRYRARRPIRIQLRRAGANHRVPARILT